MDIRDLVGQSVSDSESRYHANEHASFRYPDDAFHDVFVASWEEERQVEKVIVHFSWCDQGWGNRKGNIRITAGNSLDRRGYLRFPEVAPHERAAVVWQINGNDADGAERGVIEEIIEARCFCLQVRVGGGGGHRLQIRQLNVRVHWRPYYKKRKWILHLLILLRDNRAHLLPLAALLRRCGVQDTFVEGSQPLCSILSAIAAGARAGLIVSAVGCYSVALVINSLSSHEFCWRRVVKYIF